MRAFLMKYFMFGQSMKAERQAFTLLASVCSSWRLTLTGWPQSGTPDWVRHKLRKLIKCKCFFFDGDTFDFALAV